MKRVFCNNCNKELPSGSNFCQYCGSKDVFEIETIESTNNEEKELKEEKMIIKKCKDCGKVLPLDSMFCQYCGSKNVIDIKPEETKTEPQKMIEYNTPDNQTKAVNTAPNNKYKTPFIIVSVIAVFAILVAGVLYLNMSSLEEDISALNKKLKKVETNASNYEKRANKYDSINNMANQYIYSDFRTDTYFVKGTSKTVNVYCNFSGSYTVYPYVNGSGIDLSWGDWSGSGYNRYCPMYITCTSSGYGTITLTNSYNKHKIIIFVTGS